MTVFVPSDKIQAFNKKLEFWKISTSSHELDNFQKLRICSDEAGGDITKCDALIFCHRLTFGKSV